MIVFGKRNYEELVKSLMIPGVWTTAKCYRFLPIYKVKIGYDEQ